MTSGLAALTALCPSRRRLRLASGLVLFTYLGAHLADHALGLVSVALAERALAVAVAVWHSLPGTLLLYGAAAVHVALAFQAVYERRTLRMPAAQALRIALGFGMPLLVIGHVAATRLAAELYALAPSYQRIVWTLWTSDAEGRQLALLVPGWAHGCMGLHFAFGRHAAWQRARPLLFGTALLLPVLAGLGFLAMGRELAPHAADPSWLAQVQVVDGVQRVALGRLRDTLVGSYFALVAAVFVARELRAQFERRTRSLVRIAYPRRSVDVPRGWTVLEASRSFGIAHLSMCGGNARCSTCRVRVVSGAGHCPPPAPAEARTLARIGAPADVRLACQLRPIADVAVVPLLDASTFAHAGSDAPAPVVERELAILCLRLCSWNASTRSPHDLVYALNRVLAVVGDAIGAAGGIGSGFDADGATASFGSTTDPATACRQALDAAARIERGLDELNGRLRQEIGLSAVYTLGLHVGPSAIGPVGYGRERFSMAVGETAHAARALCDDAAQHGTRLAISRAAAAAAGIVTDGLDWQTLPGGALAFARLMRVGDARPGRATPGTEPPRPPTAPIR